MNLIFWSRFIWLLCASSDIQIILVPSLRISKSSVNLWIVVRNTPPLSRAFSFALRSALLSTLTTVLSPINFLAFTNCLPSSFERHVATFVQNHHRNWYCFKLVEIFLIYLLYDCGKSHCKTINISYKSASVLSQIRPRLTVRQKGLHFDSSHLFTPRTACLTVPNY